jgi:hypothetical protein
MVTERMMVVDGSSIPAQDALGSWSRRRPDTPLKPSLKKKQKKWKKN